MSVPKPICPHCKRPFEPPRKHPEQKFCSYACSTRAMAQRFWRGSAGDRAGKWPDRK